MLWSAFGNILPWPRPDARPSCPMRGEPPLRTPRQTHRCCRAPGAEQPASGSLLSETRLMHAERQQKLRRLHLTRERGRTRPARRAEARLRRAEWGARGRSGSRQWVPRGGGVPFLSEQQRQAPAPGARGPLRWHRGPSSSQAAGGSSAGRLTHPCSWNSPKTERMLWAGSNCILWAGASSRWSLLKKKYFHVGLK